jgi:hypothetical protein
MTDEQQDNKKGMLDYLDEIRRRVQCDDIIGFSIVALTGCGQVLNRRSGDTDDPLFLLVEQQIADRHRVEYMMDHNCEDTERRPVLLSPANDDTNTPGGECDDDKA